MADLFLTGDDLAYLTNAVASWVPYGIGFGAVAWIIGQAVAIIWQLVRY